MKHVTGSFIVAALMIGLLSGCAGFGVWSSTAQKDIAAFDAWADEWVGGAVKEAPAILSAAAAVPGVSSTVLSDAAKAVAAAQGAVSVLDAVGTRASENTVQAAQAAVLSAIGTVNSTIGAVKAASVAPAVPAAAPAAVPATPATTPAAK
jgi:hypothetical protein